MKPMTLHDTFSRSMPVITVGLDTPTQEAWRHMRQHKVHHLVVTSPEGVLGILSDRQLFEASLSSEGLWKESTVVGDAYIRLDETLTDDSNLAATLDLMAQKGCSALPLVRAGKLIGIITESDLLKILRLSVSSQELSVEEKGQIVLSNPLVMNLMHLLAEAGI